MKFISYAQNLEDVLLYRALKNIKAGFYVDVGVWDPVVDSVTKAFYDMDWSGINIEPVPELFQKLVAARPRDICIQCAAGREQGNVHFNVIPGTGLSTGVDAIAQHHQLQGFKTQPQTISTVPLRTILAHYSTRDIHFLKIDVEGMEHEVIAGMDFTRNRPWILVIEATAPLSQLSNHEAWENDILSADYEHVFFDGINRYYIAKEHPELKAAFQYPPCFFDNYVRYADTPAIKDIEANFEERLKRSAELIHEAQESLKENASVFAFAKSDFEDRLRRATESAHEFQEAQRRSITTLESAKADAEDRLKRSAELAHEAHELQKKTASALADAKADIEKLKAKHAQTELILSQKLQIAIVKHDHAQRLYEDEKKHRAGNQEVLKNAEKMIEQFRQQINVLQQELAKSNLTIEYLKNKILLAQKFLSIKGKRIDELEHAQAPLLHKIRVLETAYEVLDKQKKRSEALSVEQIRRLKNLLYGVSAGTHIHRALRRMMRIERHRKIADYGSLTEVDNHVFWHVHLQRAWDELFHKTGQKSWHTHLYRAWKSLLGSPKYTPYPPSHYQFPLPVPPSEIPEDHQQTIPQHPLKSPFVELFGKTREQFGR